MDIDEYNNYVEPNTCDWPSIEWLWKRTQASKLNYDIGDAVIKNPWVRTAPAAEVFDSSELELFVRPGVKDENSGVRHQQIAHLSHLDPMTIATSLYDELIALDSNKKASNEATWFSVYHLTPTNPSLAISHSDFFSSLMNCSAVASPFSSHNHGKAVPIHSLVHCVPTSDSNRGLRKLGLTHYLSSGPHFPRQTTSFKRDSEKKLLYGLAWLPAGAFFDVHVLAQGTRAIMTMLVGCQIWITWPSTPKNRELYLSKRLADREFTINYTPLTIAMLEEVEGLCVECVGAGTSIKLGSGTFYSILALESSAYLRLDFVDADEWEVALPAMQWELDVQEEEAQPWNRHPVFYAANYTYPMWREVLKRATDEDSLAGRLAAIERLEDGARKLEEALS